MDSIHVFRMWIILHCTDAFNFDSRQFVCHATKERYANPVQTVDNVGRIQCQVLCNHNPLSMSVSYQTTSMTCEINMVSPLYNSSSWVAEHGWVVYYPSEQDLTVGARAYQPSSLCKDGVCGYAEKVVDGNIDGDFMAGSCSLTNFIPMPAHWRVQLHSPVTVKRVVIFYRTECCVQERVRSYVVTVAESEYELTNGGTECGTYPGPPASADDRPIVITCSMPVYGQHVMILADNARYLSLCEVVIQPTLNHTAHPPLTTTTTTTATTTITPTTTTTTAAPTTTTIPTTTTTTTATPTTTTAALTTTTTATPTTTTDVPTTTTTTTPTTTTAALTTTTTTTTAAPTTTTAAPTTTTTTDVPTTTTTTTPTTTTAAPTTTTTAATTTTTTTTTTDYDDYYEDDYYK